MITALLTLFVALSIPGLIILIDSAFRAPVGFEDAAGFHAINPHLRSGPVLRAVLVAH